MRPEWLLTKHECGGGALEHLCGSLGTHGPLEGERIVAVVHDADRPVGCAGAVALLSLKEVDDLSREREQANVRGVE